MMTSVSGSKTRSRSLSRFKSSWPIGSVNKSSSTSRGIARNSRRSGSRSWRTSW